MYEAEASPLIAHGAISVSQVRLAINFCAAHVPKGAFISKRSPRKLRPRNRVRLVLTEVSFTVRNRMFTYIRGNKNRAIRIRLHFGDAVTEPVLPRMLYPKRPTADTTWKPNFLRDHYLDHLKGVYASVVAAGAGIQKCSSHRITILRWRYTSNLNSV
jgi:hypothetical protein